MTISDTHAPGREAEQPATRDGADAGSTSLAEQIATRAGERLSSISLRVGRATQGLGEDVLTVQVDGRVVRQVDGQAVGSLVGLRAVKERAGIDVGVTEFFAEPERATGLHMVLGHGAGRVHCDERPVEAVVAD